jgi:hypothetical protein
LIKSSKEVNLKLLENGRNVQSKKITNGDMHKNSATFITVKDNHQIKERGKHRVKTRTTQDRRKLTSLSHDPKTRLLTPLPRSPLPILTPWMSIKPGSEMNARLKAHVTNAG